LQTEDIMGFMDTLKGLTKGHKKDIEKGIDKAAEVIESKVPDQYDSKVAAVADKVEEVVEKLPD
jgi:hypothetical protein